MTTAALLLLAVAAAPGAAPAPRTDLLTPAGQAFRGFEVWPLAGEGDTHGVRLSYDATRTDRAGLARDAEALVAAVGPDLDASNEVVVRARGRAGDAYEVAFARAGGALTRVPHQAVPADQAPFRPAAPPPAGQVRADRERTAAAAAAALRWLQLLDDDRADAAVVEAAPAFRAEIEATAQWRGLMAQRKALRYPPERVERYRAQTLGGGAAWVVTVQYATRGPDGARFLERVALVQTAGGWQVGGYGFRPAADH